jgi:hypothetical protein
MKKLTEMLDGGAWRCTYWQGRCIDRFMTERRAWRALGLKWAHRQRRDSVHRRGA